MRGFVRLRYRCSVSGERGVEHLGDLFRNCWQVDDDWSFLAEEGSWRILTACDDCRSGEIWRRPTCCVHIATMHGLEGSDCAGVPVNRPNNGAPPSAEVGEERVQAKENIAHARTRPTQRGACGSQELRGVRKAAQDRKQERFTALLHHRTVDLLRDSFFALKWKAAPGVDGVTCQAYAIGLERIGWPISMGGCSGARSRAQPSRRVYIPTPNGRGRPLGVAALEDTPVQQAVVIILTQIYEGDFQGFSSGFRPGRAPMGRWIRSAWGSLRSG